MSTLPSFRFIDVKNNLVCQTRTKSGSILKLIVCDTGRMVTYSIEAIITGEQTLQKSSFDAWFNQSLWRNDPQSVCRRLNIKSEYRFGLAFFEIGNIIEKYYNQSNLNPSLSEVQRFSSTFFENLLESVLPSVDCLD